MNKAQFESLFLAQMANLQSAVEKECQRSGGAGLEKDALISDAWELLICKGKWSGFLAGDDRNKEGDILVRWVMGFIRNLARRHRRGKTWDCVNPRSRNRRGERVRVQDYSLYSRETGEDLKNPDLFCDPFGDKLRTEEWELRRGVLQTILDQNPEKAERIRRYHEKGPGELVKEMGISDNALRIRISRDKKELREAGKSHLTPLAS